jgi:1,4-dihydroxy-2-naphthoate octaprenyltransferase
MSSLRRVRAFVRLSRLRFLTGGFLGFALGAAVASFEGQPLNVAAYLQGQLMVTAFHIMVHYANDYYDRFADVDLARTPWSGGSGVLVDGELAPRTALVAALVAALVGSGCVAAFFAQGKPVVAGIGIAIGILAWCYSAPPIRFSSNGWGELDTAIIIAILFPLAGYATLTGSVGLRPLLSALPSAAATLVLMFCVEFPDADGDRRTGKTNLVVRFGLSRARLLVYAAVAAAYAAVAVAVALGAASTLAFFSLLTLPLAWSLVEQLASGDIAEPAALGDVASRGVAFFVATMLGSTLAYVAVL